MLKRTGFVLPFRPKRKVVQRIASWVVVASLSTVSLAAEGDAPSAPFGFADLEIYRASAQSVALSVADIDGDGLRDLVYGDNSDTSIRLLFQRDEQEKAEALAAAPRDTVVRGSGSLPSSLNEVRLDQRFRVEQFYTERNIYSLQVGDLNSDGKPDLVYYGDPRELVVVYQGETGEEWGSSEAKFPILDGLTRPRALRLTDFNGDGKRDIVLLGKGKTYLIAQQEGGKLARPKTLYSTIQDAHDVDLVDVDRDGRRDLVTLVTGSAYPVTVRFRTDAEVGFGPEVRFKMLPLTDALVEDLDGDGHHEFVMIQGNTRRILAYSWRPLDHDEPVPLRSPRYLPFRPDASAKTRRLAIGDIDGNGRLDIIVSYGDTAEAEVRLQDERGVLGRPVASPTLSEVDDLIIADVDDQPGVELVVASQKEKALGLSHWDEVGRLSIPETIPLAGESLALARYPLPGGASLDGTRDGQDAFLLLTQKDSRSFRLALHTVGADRKLIAHESFEFSSSARPTALRVGDLDSDGTADVVIVIPFENARVLATRWSDEGKPTWEDLSASSDFGAGQLSSLTPAAVSVARFPIAVDEESGAAPEDGTAEGSSTERDALLVASKSHARAFAVDPRGRLEILEQFSGRGATASIRGAAAVDIDDDPALEVLLFDASTRQLDVLDRGERNVYVRVASIDMPGFEFQGFEVADLDGDGRDDVAVVGESSLALLLRGRESHGFVDFAQFDPGADPYGEIEEFGAPQLLFSGDLNDDGRRDLCFSTAPHYFLTFLRPPQAGKLAGKLQPALRFKIFEEKTYQRSQTGHGPRQALVEDVTGDSRDDLVLLIHDRILVYVQE